MNKRDLVKILANDFANNWNDDSVKMFADDILKIFYKKLGSFTMADCVCIAQIHPYPGHEEHQKNVEKCQKEIINILKEYGNSNTSTE